MARRLGIAVVVAAVALTLAGGCSNQDTGVTKEGTSMFTISSPAFEPGGLIPATYATKAFPGGTNTSIPYEWRNAPQGTKSYALVLIDRAPVAHDWVHWAVYDIPSTATSLPAGAASAGLPVGAKELKNTFGTQGYGGPQPPAGTGRHPYEATLYALDVATLPIGASATVAQLEAAMTSHILDTATITGMMSR